MTDYATFTEHNQWEGEAWRFYIPIEGNQDALKRLADATERGDLDNAYDAFDLDLTPLPEAHVDRRVTDLADDTSYMPAHTKLAGRLILPDDRDLEFDDLYKGAIAEMVVD